MFTPRLIIFLAHTPIVTAPPWVSRYLSQLILKSLTVSLPSPTNPSLVYSHKYDARKVGPYPSRMFRILSLRFFVLNSQRPILSSMMERCGVGHCTCHSDITRSTSSTANGCQGLVTQLSDTPQEFRHFHRPHVSNHFSSLLQPS